MLSFKCLLKLLYVIKCSSLSSVKELVYIGVEGALPLLFFIFSRPFSALNKGA